MSLEEKLTRKRTEKPVVMDSGQISSAIYTWTKGEGWTIDDFPAFLELAGVKTPVELSNFEKADYSFDCLTADDKKLRIGLKYGDGYEFNTNLCVTTGDGETNIYMIHPNDCHSGPKISLESRILQNEDRKLTSYYQDFGTWRTLKTEGYQLEVDVNEQKCDGEIRTMTNYHNVEAYLMGIDLKLFDVDEVYDNVMQLLGFSEEDVTAAGKVLIRLSEVKKKNKKEKKTVRAMKKLINGRLVEYAVLSVENGKRETFYASMDGNWYYISDPCEKRSVAIRIDYNKKEDNYTLTMEGHSLANVFIYNIMDYAKNYIDNNIMPRVTVKQ